MRRTSKSKLAFVLLLLGSLVGVSGASEAGSEPFMVTTGKTSQPIGHYEFCRAHKGECSVRSSGKERVKLTPALWNQLVGVNAQVNRAVTPKTDEELYGRPEVWAFPGREGDCEDIVLLKRRQLIEMGWPVGTLLVTVVRQRNGEGHAVLTVLTDRGDLILDNLQPRILVWNETDYRYVKRQSERNSGQWAAIDDVRTTAVGSLTP